MKEFVVFYAWGSDRLERLNRHLIRAALDLADIDGLLPVAQGLDEIAPFEDERAGERLKCCPSKIQGRVGQDSPFCRPPRIIPDVGAQDLPYSLPD
jgi:hypothetical protein